MKFQLHSNSLIQQMKPETKLKLTIDKENEKERDGERERSNPFSTQIHSTQAKCRWIRTTLGTDTNTNSNSEFMSGRTTRKLISIPIKLPMQSFIYAEAAVTVNQFDPSISSSSSTSTTFNELPNVTPTSASTSPSFSSSSSFSSSTNDFLTSQISVSPTSLPSRSPPYGIVSPFLPGSSWGESEYGIGAAGGFTPQFLFAQQQQLNNFQATVTNWVQSAIKRPGRGLGGKGSIGGGGTEIGGKKGNGVGVAPIAIATAAGSGYNTGKQGSVIRPVVFREFV